MSFFIHIADPGFPDPPWPGERRLGPYATAEEAISQAVNDAALGMGTAVGIYEYDGDSEVSRGAAAYSRSQIEKRADTMRRRLHAEQVVAQQEAAEILEALLPEGVTMDDLNKMAATMRAAQAAAAKKVAP